VKTAFRTAAAPRSPAEVPTASMATGEVAPVQGLRLQLAEVATSTMATVAVVSLLFEGSWVPGFAACIGVFAAIAIVPPVLRSLSQTFPRSKVLDIAASFWLIPVAALGHIYLGPVVDAVHPRLMDAYLALADLQLFGGHPSIAAARYASPWLTEILMVCYYSYFILALVLGVALYWRGRRREFDEFVLALALFYSVIYALYVAVPAIGPRFFLSGEFPTPLTGVFITPYLDALMRATPFNRDCFPSGHTGATLIVLSYAFRFDRRVFWILLPLGAGLIAATIVCRYHYAIDLICAAPIAVVVHALASALARARPHGVQIPRSGWVFQQPARI
jgi:membrane-associated phospholipid phosphatase